MIARRAIPLGWFLAALLAGCTDTDLGQRCQLQGASGPVDEGSLDPALDYVSLGVPECNEMVCVRTARTGDGGREHPYCSSECATDDDCSREETGLACRELLLDQEFLDEMRERMGEEEFRRRFGDASARYCAEPR